MGIRIPPLAQGHASGQSFLEAAGVASIAEARELSPDQIAAALMRSAQDGPFSGLRFAPLADGVVLPANPATAIAEGNYNHTPVLTGLVADEGSSMNPNYRSDDADAFRTMLEQRFGSMAGQMEALFADFPAAERVPAASRASGIASMLAWAEERRAQSAEPVYGYLFSHVEPGPDSATYGAFHSSEIPYVFQTLDKSPERPFTQRDREVSDLMAQYWANFVATGNPNGDALPDWPVLDDDAEILHIGEDVRAEPALPADTLEAYRQFIANGGMLGIF